MIFAENKLSSNIFVMGLGLWDTQKLSRKIISKVQPKRWIPGWFISKREVPLLISAEIPCLDAQRLSHSVSIEFLP